MGNIQWVNKNGGFVKNVRPEKREECFRTLIYDKGTRKHDILSPSNRTANRNL